MGCPLYLLLFFIGNTLFIWSFPTCWKWIRYSEILLLRPPKIKTFYPLKTVFAKFKLSFLHFLHPVYLWLETTFGTVQKWSLRPLLDSPKGGLNIGILLYMALFRALWLRVWLYLLRESGNEKTLSLRVSEHCRYRTTSLHPSSITQAINISCRESMVSTDASCGQQRLLTDSAHDAQAIFSLHLVVIKQIFP